MVPRPQGWVAAMRAHGGTKASAHECLLSLAAALGPSKALHFLETGPTAPIAGGHARLVGSFRALSSRSSSSTSLFTWVARTMIRRSLSFSRLPVLLEPLQDPVSYGARRAMILPARSHPFTPVEERIRLICLARFAVPVDVSRRVTSPRTVGRSARDRR